MSFTLGSILHKTHNYLHTWIRSCAAN